MRSDRSMDHFTTLLTHRGYRVTVVGSVLLLKTAVSLLPYVFNGSMLWSKSDSCSAMPLAILLYVVHHEATYYLYICMRILHVYRMLQYEFL